MSSSILTTEFVVKRTGNPWEADILQHGGKVASLQKGENLNYVVRSSTDGNTFVITPKVDGVVRPFSFEIYEESSGERKQVLKIKDHLFSYKGQMYILKSVPEGRPKSKHLLGARYICRLVNFPYTRLEEIDLLTKGRLQRYRGVDVGELSGLGTNGHKVKLKEELEDVGIPLAAASYLMYSSA